MRNFKPTLAQEKILTLKQGKHLVLAPPGSGKTELLALRVPAAMDRGVTPESMLCVTFTNRAARNMVNRIGEMPGKKPFVGTLHNFAMRFLFANNLIPANTVLLDEEDSEQLLSDALQSVLEESRSVRSVKLSDVAGYTRAHGQSRLCLKGIADAFTVNPFLEKVVVRYEQMKTDSCSINFDDSLHLALHYLMHGKPSNLRSFSWVQVDEVQDLSELQWAILGRLTADDAHVVYFGDYDQAIYSFMGASHAALTANTKGATLHHLDENYRSSPALIKVFNDYAAANLPSRKELQLVPGKESGRSGGRIEKQMVSGTFSDEAHAIAVRFVPKLLADCATTAVLTRTNAESETISRNLTANSIDHFKVSGFDLFRRRPIKDVMAFLRAHQFPLDRHAWTRLLDVFGGVDTLHASRELVSELFESGLNPVDWLTEPVGKSTADHFAAAFKKGRIVVFDTETTGLNIATDDIVQIAATEIVDGVPTGRELELFINTEQSLDASTPVHGITPEYLRIHGIPARQALERFLEFAGDSTIVGHNVRFDLDILTGNLDRVGVFWNPDMEIFDTLKLARCLHPRLFSYKLGFLLETLKIEGKNTHNALDDVRATAALARSLVVDADAGQAHRADIIKRYKKYLDRFSRTLAPLWINVAHKLDEDANLYEVIEDFFTYAVKHARYLLSKDDREHIGTLLGYLKKNTPRRPLRQLMASLVPELSTYSEADLITGGEKVVVSTIHKAKGLQFESVVVTGCVKDIYPHFYSKSPSAIEEDARLLYVALTRAQQSIILTMHDTNENRGGRWPRWSSPFLEFLDR